MRIGSPYSKVGSQYLLLGLCLSLVGAGPARERVSSEGNASWGQTGKATPALVAEEGGRLSLQAAGRRFEFGEGQLAVSVEDSSWTYRFQGSRGGIRALSLSTLPEQSARDSVQYRHGEGIVERYVVRSRGVEQQFLLPGPYAGGDVLLTGSVQTDLVPAVASSFEGIAFRRDDVTVLYYGEAKAIDAGGRTALLEERWSEGELTIVVPASFLAGAKFPVLVDPFIGGRNTVDAAVDLAQNPAVATTETTPLQALAVWSTDITSPQSIRGRIIGPRGNTIVGPISAVDEFSLAGDYYTNPRVAWSPSDAVWVVAANGSPNGPNFSFIQVNKVSTSGTKTTGANLNADVIGGEPERDVDVACNDSGLCLITWLLDSNNNGTLDSVRGVFYTPSTNTFGSIFPLSSGTFTRSHSRVASNGTSFYEVNGVSGKLSLIEGYSVTSGGAVTQVDPSQSGAAPRLNPDVAHNDQLNAYLVAWETGAATIRGSTLTDATPPVPSGADAELFPIAVNPQIDSQQWMGWSMAIFEPGGTQAATLLVRPNLTFASFIILDATGAVPSADVAHFFRGLSIVVYEDERGVPTDPDIRAREFIAPAMEYADFDNDGYASGFVWRPGTNAYFYYNEDLTSVSTNSVQFGTTGDIPVRMVDYFTSGIPVLAVFRPSSGYWYIDFDRNGTVDFSLQFGASGDIPVPGDYNRDGTTDVAVFRPSTGFWYVDTTADGAVDIQAQFGTFGDIPVPADYNGDYFTDFGVWRPSTGTWYVDTNRNGTVDIQAQFGTSGDIPVPGDYGPSGVSNAPDGSAEFAVFRPSTGYWYISRNRDGVVSQATQFGTNGDIPVGGIFDSNPDVNSPFAVFRKSNGTWYVDVNNNGTVNVSRQFGTLGDIPMQQPSGQYRN
jgi:hypothetical protein